MARWFLFLFLSKTTNKRSSEAYEQAKGSLKKQASKVSEVRLIFRMSTMQRMPSRHLCVSRRRLISSSPNSILRICTSPFCILISDPTPSRSLAWIAIDSDNSGCFGISSAPRRSSGYTMTVSSASTRHKPPPSSNEMQNYGGQDR